MAKLLRPTAAMCLLAYAIAWIHPFGYVQAVWWASARFGLAKSIAFCLVLRWHWFPVWPEAKASAREAAVDSEELVAFVPAVNTSCIVFATKINVSFPLL